MANPFTPPPTVDTRAIWAYWIPRVFHDIISVWSITYWVWAVVDASHLSKKEE